MSSAIFRIYYTIEGGIMKRLRWSIIGTLAVVVLGMAGFAKLEQDSMEAELHGIAQAKVAAPTVDYDQLMDDLGEWGQ